ncbi:FxDxF family PEP-CTERM protein [Altericroceibacterium xinjiangense]|uniref:FxDxF family PEP-CTERM protein n=1 Tax=Altericroceibacterium xinjiangense TaxID=762261 RepID=UPI000F7E6D63|nr:FxDxF family PEP-CTERM protein [Altericroceibacterium xinjiangense]
MRKSVLIMAGVAATVLGASTAHADVTCTPSSCVITGTDTVAPNASFIVQPSGVNESYFGPISASFGNTVTEAGMFTDMFNFQLPTNGFGGGSVTTVAASFQGPTDIDFTSVLINGISASIQKTAQGIVEIGFASDVVLNSGFNNITVNGLARGNGSYGGSMSFTPVIPEPATWGMMILGFMGIGATMRYRRKSTKVSYGTKAAFA